MVVEFHTVSVCIRFLSSTLNNNVLVILHDHNGKEGGYLDFIVLYHPVTKRVKIGDFPQL